MPYDPYEDPEIRGDSGDFPLTVKFQVFGDRVRGVIVEIDRWDPPARKPGETPKPILKYKLAEVTVSQLGTQSRVDRAELLAGAVNLSGQLLTLKPGLGDEVDITYVSDRKGSGSFPTKIFRIDVFNAEGVQQPSLEQHEEPVPQPLRAVGGDDLFDRR